jgi:hypothetical protein
MDTYCCPHCGSRIRKVKTVVGEDHWFCVKCTYGTWTEHDLKRIKEEKKCEFTIEELEEIKRPPMTEEARSILMNIIPF